jgi:hypothetical protein
MTLIERIFCLILYPKCLNSGIFASLGVFFPEIQVFFPEFQAFFSELELFSLNSGNVS